MTDTQTDKYQQEVDKNYAVFQKLIEDDTYYRDHYGKYALMKNEKVVQFFDTREDARKTAKLLYHDEPFSIQEITKTPVDLGYYSHAVL